MSTLAKLCWNRIDPNLPPGIHLPKRKGDVGYDLEAMEDIVIPPMAHCDVPVNAEIQLPSNMWASIRNRSSMGRRGLYVDQNVIDNGYRGPVFVLIRNMRLPGFCIGDGGRIEPEDGGFESIKIAAGERIGQLVFHSMTMVHLDEVEEIERDTERGPNGFGSTGL